MIETLNLTFSDIHPFVRYVQRLSVSPDNYPVFTRPYDCRLFFVHVGSGRLYIGNEIWELKHGDVVLWQCGEHYHMDSKTTDGMYFLGTNFDYTQAYRYKDYPIPPDRSDRFKESEAMKRVHFVDNAEFDHPMLVHNMHSIEEILLEMMREFQTRKVYWREKINSQMAIILSQVARQLSLHKSEIPQTEHNIDHVISYIQENSAKLLDNETLGRHFNYHPNYLNHLMRLTTGKTLHQYLINCRIQKAIDYLETSDYPITEVARLTGFNDVYHFSKIFKQKTGNNPSSYRRPR